MLLFIFRQSFRRRNRLRRPRNNLRPWMRFRRALLQTALYLAAIFIVHSAAMMGFENLSLGDAVWLTLTTLTTVGYGDISAATFGGRAATVGLLYIGGIFVVAKMAGDYFEYRALRRMAMRTGDWKWDDMSEHIIIVGAKRESIYRLQRLLEEIANNPVMSDKGVILISNLYPDGLPPLLENLELRLVRGTASDPRILENAAAESAAYVFILTWDEDDIASDARTFDIVHRFRAANSHITIVAETVDDQNRDRLTAAGANILLRPVKAYPEMLISAAVSPGTGEILENLFTASGEKLNSREGPVSGTWTNVVQNCLAENLGLPIAYRDKQTRKVVTAPKGGDEINADALFVLTK